RVAREIDAAVTAFPINNIPAPDRPYANLGSIYAMLGRTDKAKEVLAQIAQISDSTTRLSFEPDAHTIRGEIALAENRGLEAVTEFARADSLPDGAVGEDPNNILFQTGRAFERANQPDSAISRYEQYLRVGTTARLGEDMINLPVIQRKLGELYQAKGDRARAIVHYTAFVNLWKNADADLQPQVTDAKKKIALLSAN
ncbi:MAG: tetratricopeptide repeat protein, partial [Gemmatimonadaceae bacterium]